MKFIMDVMNVKFFWAALSLSMDVIHDLTSVSQYIMLNHLISLMTFVLGEETLLACIRLSIMIKSQPLGA